ncbi:CMD domain-containing protein [Enterobacteriaceae bacterium 89]|nr:CMD domain-containing protein [Enterobacteriaceae bacterium 89]
MEQHHLTGKSQWYHETQSRNQDADVLPLVPEAAHVADRFLLDLPLPQPVSDCCSEWLNVSSRIASHLFPATLPLSRLNTFSVYERLSTALTVAQVSGVQRLCNHYAARLAPLPGPDSSRESNYRLAQITQYARQLAGSPFIISADSRQQLDAVGLTAPDIVLITQIVGFVGYQARVIAAGQALLGMPTRWIPGMPMQDEAPASLFSGENTEWKAGLTEMAQPEFTESPNAKNKLMSLLAWDSPLADLGSQLLDLFKPECDQATFIAVVNARINGSSDCFRLHAVSPSLAESARQGEKALQRWCQDQPPLHSLLQAVLMLTKAPDRFSETLISPLFEHGHSQSRVLTLLAWSGFSGWYNRLKIGLGEVSPVT